MDQFCSYYQAHIPKTEVLFVVATLKLFDHLCFDRAIDPETSRFEFFVPESGEQQFVQIMHFFAGKGMVQDLKKLPNRLMEAAL